MSGLSLPVTVGSNSARIRFDEDLLFTHRGLSGPAILQISTHCDAGDALHIDLAPGLDLQQDLIAAKARSKRGLGTELAQRMPRCLADTWLAIRGIDAEQPLASMRDR